MTAFLKEFHNFITENKINVFRVSEMIDGTCETDCILPTNRCQNVYSVAKVFTVTALGMLYDRGLLDFDSKVVNIFPDMITEKTDPRWNDITVDHLIRHRCGFKGSLLDIDVAGCYGFGEDGDYMNYLANYPLKDDPGSVESYNDAGYYLLARIAEKIGGETIDIPLNRAFFSVIKCPEFAFTKSPKNHLMGATGLYTDTETMAKMGELYRCGGVICGKRVLSQQFVDLVLEREYELSERLSGKGYGKGGMYGQHLLVIPSQNRVIAWQGFHRENAKLLEFVAAGV